jgi:hypothetical protein
MHGGVCALGKAACTFREADVTRAFKAARKAGVDVQVEIDLERKRMTITPINIGGVTRGTTEKNDWDGIYEQG